LSIAKPLPNTEHPGPLAPASPLRPVLALAASVGLFAQVAQIVMFREMLAICRGTEVFFGVVMAAGLGWTALGSVVAGLLARRGARREPARWPARAWSYAAALFALNGLLLIGQIALARHRAAAWGGAGELTFLQAVATAAVATAPVAFACGVEFVLALHAAPPESFGRLYQADAWGAVAGALAFTFLLLGLLDPVTLGPALTAALGLIILLAGGRRWVPTAVVIGLAAAVCVHAGKLDHWLHVRRWQALLPKFTLRATEESRYGRIAVLRHPTEPQFSLYLDGGLVETLPPPDAPATDERNATLFALAQHPNPRRILLVGGALGRFPTELQRLSGAVVVALELDPALVALAQRFTVHAEGLRSGATPKFPLGRAAAEGTLKQELERGTPGSGPHLVFEDARRAIRRLGLARSCFDLIVIQLPAPLSAFVNRYFTEEFFQEARNALRKDGVLITTVMAAANYQGETVGQLSASVVRTLRAVFPEVLVAPGETHTFIASREPGVTSLEPATLARRIAGRGIVLPDMDPAYRDALEPYYTALFENLILTSQVAHLRETLDAIPAPINTDARPIVYEYALLVWNQIVSADLQARDPGLHSGTNALFRAALALRFPHGLVLPGLLLLPAVVLAVRGRLRGRTAPPRAAATYGLLALAFAVGLFGLAAEIILLYTFQGERGCAYVEVGLIVAVFMVGLAVGARAGVGWQRRSAALPWVILATVLYCLGLPLALGEPLARDLSGALPPLVFQALVFAAGFLDGAAFPLLVAAMGRLGFERPGPWVYAADLAGSAFGALVTGALLVPILGTGSALILVALTLLAAWAAMKVGQPY